MSREGAGTGGATRSREYRGWTLTLAAGWDHWTVDLSKAGADGRTERHAMRAPTEPEAIASARAFVDQLETAAELRSRPGRWA